MKVNLRKGSKYGEAREWAYDLIANSTGTTSSEMAEMMAEQFGHTKTAMGHTLHQMIGNGALKTTGSVVFKGKRTFVLAAARRRVGKEAAVEAPVPVPEAVPALTKTINGTSAPMIVVQTINGPMFLTGAQAKAIVEGITEMFK